MFKCWFKKDLMYIFLYAVLLVAIGTYAFEQENTEKPIEVQSKQSDHNFNKNNDNVVSEKETFVDYESKDYITDDENLKKSESLLPNNAENLLNKPADEQKVLSGNNENELEHLVDEQQNLLPKSASSNLGKVAETTDLEETVDLKIYDKKPDGETVFTNKDVQEKMTEIKEKIKKIDESKSNIENEIKTVQDNSYKNSQNSEENSEKNFNLEKENFTPSNSEINHDIDSSVEIDKLHTASFKNDFKSVTKNGEDLSINPNSDNRDSSHIADIESSDLVQKLYEEAIHLLTQEKKDYTRAYKLLINAADQNHTLAMEKVVYSLLFGDHIERNMTKAVEIFHKLASKGSPVGQQGLGFIYGIGLTVPSSQAKALIYSTFGALGGDLYAQMMLGYRSYVGIGVVKGCEAALTYYKKVAESVSNKTSSHGGVAVQRVRLYDELEQPGGVAGQIDEDLLQYYHFLADKGDLQAQVGLGQLYFQGGRGIEVNYEKAFKYFQLAANAGNGNGLAYLGKMYLEGLHVSKDVTKALEFFKKSTDQANPIGQAGIGMMYLNGDGVPKDYNQAIKYFSQAAEQGWVEGQLQLGNMYYNGMGVKQDYKQAIKYFTYASQSGHVLAFYNLAQMHASGAGGIRSCNTAVELFKNVAERGKWSAMFMDAYDAYKSGDVDTALLKYYFLAELGYEVAQSNVAYILDKDDVEMFEKNQTYQRALLQWSRAAQQGYAVARVKVGDYHYYGLGTKVDFETAALHYKLACDQQNNPQAMFNLGYMHEQGLGLKQDMHLAKRFYDMAALASPDAQIPVYLALCKLTVIFTWEWVELKYNMLKEMDFTAEVYRIWVATFKMLGPDWDVYIITVLVGLLAAVVLFRRMFLH